MSNITRVGGGVERKLVTTESFMTFIYLDKLVGELSLTVIFTKFPSQYSNSRKLPPSYKTKTSTDDGYCTTCHASSILSKSRIQLLQNLEQQYYINGCKLSF